MAIRLICRSGAFAGKSFSFDHGPIYVGRDPSNQVAFDPHQDAIVSARHCQIYETRDQWCVVDLGSRHGTFLNGQRLTQPAWMAHGSVLQFGPTGPELLVDLSTIGPGDQAMQFPGTMVIRAVEAEIPPAPAPPAQPVQPTAALLAPVEQRPRNRLLWFLYMTLLGLVLLILAALAFKLYVGSLFAETAIDNALAQLFGAGSCVKSARIDWPSDVFIEGIDIPDPQRPEIAAARASEVRVTWDPWELWSKRLIKRIAVVDAELNLYTGADGAWNLKLPRSGGGASVAMDQAKVLVLQSELTADLGSGPINVERIDLALQLPDSSIRSPLRVENFSAQFSVPALSLSGGLASNHLLLGPFESPRSQAASKPSQYWPPFTGSLRLQELKWGAPDEKPGIDLPGAELRFDGALRLSDTRTEMRLDKLEIEDYFSCRRFLGQWNGGQRVVSIENADLKADLAGVRRVLPAFTLLDTFSGTPEITISNFELALPSASDTRSAAIALKMDFSTPANENRGSLVRIAPRVPGATVGRAYLAHLTGARGHAELRENLLTVSGVRLDLAFGSSPALVTLGSSAARLDDPLPLWLQLAGSTKDLNVEVPLGGFSRSEFLRGLLGGELLLDGSLQARHIAVTRGASGGSTIINLNEIAVKGLEVLRWPIDSLLIDKPDGKLEQTLDLRTEWTTESASATATTQLVALAARTHLTGAGLDLSALLRLDRQKDAWSVQNLALTVPVEELLRMSPLLRMAECGGSGVVALQNVAFEICGAKLTACTGELELRDAAFFGKLGQALGMLGVRGVNGRIAARIDSSDPARAMLRIEGSLGRGTGKPLEFFSPDFSFKTEAAENLRFSFSTDLLPRNGGRAFGLSLTWKNGDTPRSFELTGSYALSANARQVYEVNAEINTSLFPDSRPKFKALYDAEKRAVVPISIDIGRTSLRELCAGLAQLPALAAWVPGAEYRGAVLNSFRLQFSGDPSPALFAEEKLDQRWKVDCEFQTAAPQPASSRDAESISAASLSSVKSAATGKLSGIIRRERGPPGGTAWAIEDVSCRIRGSAMVQVLGWQFRTPKDWSEDIKCEGLLKLRQSPNSFTADVPDTVALQIPELELRSNSQQPWLQIPRSVVRATHCSATFTRDPLGTDLKCETLGLRLADWLNFELENAVLKASTATGLQHAEANRVDGDIEDLARTRSLLLGALRAFAGPPEAPPAASPAVGLQALLAWLNAHTLGGRLSVETIRPLHIDDAESEFGITLAGDSLSFADSHTSIHVASLSGELNKASGAADMPVAASLKGSEIEVAGGGQVLLRAPEFSESVSGVLTRDRGGPDAPGGLTLQWQARAELPGGATFGTLLSILPNERGNICDLSGKLQYSIRGDDETYRILAPLNALLPALTVVPVTASTASRSFSTPPLKLSVEKGQLQNAPASSRLRDAALRIDAAGESLVEASVESLELDAPIDAMTFSNAAINVTDLRRAQQHVLAPLQTFLPPQVTTPQIAGALAVSEAYGVWRKTGEWAVKLLTRFDNLSATFDGVTIPHQSDARLDVSVDGLSGSLPVALYDGAWPPQWEWDRAGELNWRGARAAVRAAGVRYGARSPQTKLTLAFQPNQCVLNSPLTLVPDIGAGGSTVTLNWLKLANPLAPLSDIQFGLGVELRMADCATALGWDLNALWMNLATHDPFLCVNLPACRVRRLDTAWDIELGAPDSAPRDPPRPGQYATPSVAPLTAASMKNPAIMIAARDNRSHRAISIAGLNVRGLRVPRALSAASLWQLQRLDLGDIRFGDFGLLFENFSNIDLTLEIQLEDVRTTGDTTEDVLRQCERFRLQIKTPEERRKAPFYNVLLTDSLKQRLIKTFEIAGLAASVVSSQKRYEFEQVGVVVKLQDNVLTGVRTIHDRAKHKLCAIRGIGMFDPSDPWGAEDMVCFWPEFVNKIQTRAVNVMQFASLVRQDLTTEIDAAKRAGTLGESTDGWLVARVDPVPATLAKLIKQANAFRETNYRAALDEYYKLPPGSPDAERHLTLIRQKAGRLNRGAVLADKHTQCWVEHPLTHTWLRAAELHQEFVTLYARARDAEISE